MSFLARVNKAKKDLEISLEFFRRKRRPFGSILSDKSNFRCVDFKRLKGVENLEFFCSVCAEVRKIDDCLKLDPKIIVLSFHMAQQSSHVAMILENIALCRNFASTWSTSG